MVATAFFVIFYFALPVLVGYWPELMERKVWGAVNWAYTSIPTALWLRRRGIRT